MTDTQNLLLSAANDVAKAHVETIKQAVIAAMSQSDATGMMGDFASRHLWDDYCWHIQEGPFDNDDIGFGSTDSNFQITTETFIEAELEKLAPSILHLLGVYICDAEGMCEGCVAGGYSLEELTAFILQRLDETASRRNLGLIGPDRADVICYDHTLNGLVGEALNEAEERSDLLSQHADALLSDDPAIHKQVSHELLERYMQLLHEAAEDSFALTDLLSKFNAEIRQLVLERDLVPHLEDLIGQLQESLDDY
ncbi:hypothetical protein [Comamonas aquatica]|uniref:hypothetical protein n=1 Tax=Comamonas aquatica TaxID=225991 RepID=UPI001B39553E|nr:hypothetical protein [Comamonas aquatica]QTX22463.1 hypothetical protein KAQ61_08675 [Comamonas aquatica]